jgi:UDP-N-acetyl-D-mannosaminuronic acid dehydrogenase
VFDYEVTLIGGCGHVGLPLGITLADRGLRVALYDIDERAVALVNSGRMPADEFGAAEVLQRVIGDSLVATTDPAAVAAGEHLVVVIGTPVGSHLSPDPQAVPATVASLAPYLRSGQLLVLRSTVYPGVTAQVERTIARLGLDIEVAFCPERIAEGRAMRELVELPQLVAARSEDALARASKLFLQIAPKVVTLEPEEAELAKLFTNTWRYIKFATANQLYMMANDFGHDYERIRSAIVDDYPRAADLSSAGFAAGPCLLKDTMQLAEFDASNFSLGHASMAINEGLPNYVVARLERRFDLRSLSVGILGMAFKAESDDIRSSLAYKLKRVLSFTAASVLCTDPYVACDPSLLPLDEVLERADLLVIGAPHRQYRNLQCSQPLIDIWGLLNAGVRV